MSTLLFRKIRRYVTLALTFLVLMVYLWQMVTAWQDELNPYGIPQSSGIIWRAGGVQLNQLTGTAVASRTTATLRADRRADTGELLVENLPMLPPTEIYRLWGIDATGTIDAAADFDVPYESAGTFVVKVITPQLLTTYTRFLITVESANGSTQTPSGRIVMSR
jgi:hypothetical protein